MQTELDSDDGAQKCYGRPSLDGTNDLWHQGIPVTTVARTPLQSFQVVSLGQELDYLFPWLKH